MLGKAKLLFQFTLLLPVIAGCVLLVSLFPPYRRKKKHPAWQDAHKEDALSAFTQPLAEDILAPKKG